METYIVLMEMTSKGLDEIEKVPDFVDSFENKVKKLGGEFKGFYKVMGETDYVTIFEAPNSKVGLALVIVLGKTGYFSTLTLKAYSMSEMRESLRLSK